MNLVTITLQGVEAIDQNLPTNPLLSGITVRVSFLAHVRDGRRLPCRVEYEVPRTHNGRVSSLDLVVNDQSWVGVNAQMLGEAEEENKTALADYLKEQACVNEVYQGHLDQHYETPAAMQGSARQGADTFPDDGIEAR